MKVKQHGKGLAGFFVGLLLATAVIAGVLFFLNKNGQSSLKGKEASQPAAEKEIELLVPNSGSISSIQASSASEAVQAASDAASASGSSEPDSESMASEPVSDDAASQEQLITPQSELPVDNQAAIAAAQARKEQSRRQAELKRQEEIKKAQAAKKTQEQKKAVKPSPEQILEQGNVERARKQATKDAAAAAKKEADSKKAEALLNGRSGKQESSSASGGKVILQIGSYGNQQAADAQRAKLAMMGVSANVVEGTVNGKTVYRVQTGSLDAKAAANTRKKLQQNGIASLTRSASR